ncbi:MAG TPA: SDR family oxidoreductase [Brevefilum sp.]
MKLTIFGATGRTGKHLVRHALARGHEVVAYIRTPGKLDIQHHQLHIVVGDVQDKEKVAQAVEGADAVINAIGPSPNSPKDLMETTARNIVSAMKMHHVQRLIWSTGAGIRAPQDQPSLMHKAFGILLKLMSPRVLESAGKGAQIIQSSDLQWTIARAPMLTYETRSADFYIGYVNSEMGRTLSRENYAKFMLDLAEGDDWVQDMPAASDR